VTVSLSNIQVTNFNLAQLSATLTPPQTLTLAANGLNFHLTMNWRWRRNHWPHISSSGSVDVTPVNGAASISVGVSVANGRPVVSVSADSVTFQDFKISFHGSWLSWLYDFISDILKSTIKKSVQTAASNAIQKAIDNTLNGEFGKLPLLGHLGGGKSRVNIDFAFVSTQMGTAGSTVYFAIGDSFAVADNETGTLCPLVPPAFPDVAPTPNPNMMQIFLADEFINCISWVSFINGGLSVQITNSELPPKFPLHLNTSDWALFIPQLAILYPNHLMVLDIFPSSYPAVTSDPVSGLSGAGSFNVNCSVVNPDGSLTYVFTLGAPMGLGLDVSVRNAQPPLQNSTVFLNLTKLFLNLTVENSAIGEFSISSLDTLLSIVEPLIETIVDVALAKGFPLPLSPGFEFVQPQVTFEKGYFTIGTDFSYNPNADAAPAPPAVDYPSVGFDRMD